MWKVDHHPANLTILLRIQRKHPIRRSQRSKNRHCLAQKPYGPCISITNPLFHFNQIKHHDGKTRRHLRLIKKSSHSSISS